ncbi:hypothetical protein Misp01_68240 [Microtetraspora sp. NBRC 13810]|uniref:hypothetical protein n=1 Tax=Microtetraspora sp. NBRC 13810 TaxID=3030990 RepID=UPI0024A02516|nr:hypothetical protein [Microtetraspora sp. NBRC 13810]GLW11696.1 hypothetical protein Misp01_68240 [Microtetraspora sp. NBRC 13810]
MTGRNADAPVAGLLPVSVETLMLRADAGGWSYRRTVTVPVPGETPDQAARRACGVDADAAATVVHSTSWRYLPEGRIVLTYAVCPDPAPRLPGIRLATLEIARGVKPAEPAPPRVRVADVAAHAVRHLASLTVTDPVVRRALAGCPEIRTALADLTPASPGPGGGRRRGAFVERGDAQP